MAITVTHLGGVSQNFDNDATSYTTSNDLVPVAGRRYIVATRISRGTNPADIGALTHSGSLTFADFTGATGALGQDASIAQGCRLRVFEALAGASPTPGTLLLTLTNTHRNCQMLVFEITGLHVTLPYGVNGANQNTGNASENDTTDGDVEPTIPAALQNALSGALSIFTRSNSTAAETIPTGWTDAGSLQTSSPAGRLQAAFILTNDLIADWTSGDTGGTIDMLGWITELVAAPEDDVSIFAQRITYLPMIGGI